MKLRFQPLIVAVGIFLLLNSFCFTDENNLFFSIVKKGGLRFYKPSSTKEVALIHNDELNYQYAIKDTLNNMEIRYLVYPLQEMVNHYNGPHADTGIERIDPNFMHTNLLLAYAYRVQGKEMSMDVNMPEINEISHAAIDKAFHADWGAYVNIQPCDEFAQKYKYCTIWAIHKDDLADAFIIYLYDDKDAFLLQKPFEAGADAEFSTLVFQRY